MATSIVVSPETGPAQPSYSRFPTLHSSFPWARPTFLLSIPHTALVLSLDPTTTPVSRLGIPDPSSTPVLDTRRSSHLSFPQNDRSRPLLPPLPDLPNYSWVDAGTNMVPGLTPRKFGYQGSHTRGWSGSLGVCTPHPLGPHPSRHTRVWREGSTQTPEVTECVAKCVWVPESVGAAALRSSGAVGVKYLPCYLRAI